MNELIFNTPQIHTMFDGRSVNIDCGDYDIGLNSSDEQIKNAVADHLGVPNSKLASMRVFKNEATGDITVTPSASFG